MKVRAWAALAAVVFAQPQERPQFRASSQLVLVPVQVTTQAGKTVESLSEADFELYDYESDPLERKNLASSQPEIVTQLRAILARHPEAAAPIEQLRAKR